MSVGPRGGAGGPGRGDARRGGRGGRRAGRSATRASARPRCSPRSALSALAVGDARGRLAARRRGRARGRRRRAALVALGILAALLYRRPRADRAAGRSARSRSGCRSPLGGETASLLIPLYGVIAAGALAEAFRWLRRGTGPDALDVAEAAAAPAAALRADRARRRRGALRACRRCTRPTSRWRSRTSASSTPRSRCCWRLLRRRRLDPGAAARRVLARRAGSRCVFAAVGFYEYATGHLLLSNAKVQEANDLKPYFRVNSLFFDPNIYGRFLALTMIALAADAAVERASAAPCCSSRVALGGAVGGAGALAVAVELRGAARRASPCSAALRWSPLAGARRGRRLGARAAVGVVLLAPGALEIDTRSDGLAGQGDQRPLRPRQRRAVDGPRPAGVGLRLRLVRRALPGPRGRALRAAWRPSRTRSRSRWPPSRA